MTEEEYEKIKKGLYGPPTPPAPKPPSLDKPKTAGQQKRKKKHNPFKDGSTPTSRSYSTGP